MPRLKLLPPRVPAARQASVAPAPKVADPYYATAEWRGPEGLREQALRRDGFRCTVPGCGEPACVVDHVTGRRWGGSDDLVQLRSLCRAHDNRFKEDHMGRRRGGG